MPEYGKFALVPLEAEEVEDEGIHDLVWQSILLIEQYADEERVGPRVVHVCELEQGGARVEHWDGDLREYGADDDRFPKCARSAL